VTSACNKGKINATHPLKFDERPEKLHRRRRF